MENENSTHENQSYSGTASTMAVAQDRGHDLSVAAFVLGICSIAAPLLIPAIGLIVGLICGIVGIVLANRAKQTDALSNLGQAGFVMSIIGTALCGLIVLAGIVLVAVGLSAFSSIVGAVGSSAWHWFV